MPKIVTTFTPDGAKVRKPVGYTGGACNRATEPYERFDVPGTRDKVATADACRPEVVKTETETQIVATE